MNDELDHIWSALAEGLVRYVRDRVRGELCATDQPERWLTPEEAATHAGVEKDTLLAWHRTGGLVGGGAGRVLRFKASDIDAYLRALAASQRRPVVTDAQKRARETVASYRTGG